MRSRGMKVNGDNCQYIFAGTVEDLLSLEIAHIKSAIKMSQNVTRRGILDNSLILGHETSVKYAK